MLVPAGETIVKVGAVDAVMADAWAMHHTQGIIRHGHTGHFTDGQQDALL
jgi:hypothetical protein